MKVKYDLIGGAKPPTMELWYNTALAADGGTARYKGSLVKAMDWSDVDHGYFMCFAGETTAMENVCGILEEDVTLGYLPDSSSGSVYRRKITPIFPSTVIEAEYVQADAAGTANYDTSGTASAAGTTFTITITTADRMIGGWIYFLTGSNAGKLHYITDNDTTTATFSTAVTYAVASSDTFLVIQPPISYLFDINATYTGLKSEIDDGSRGDVLVGLDHWISAPNTGKVRLVKDIHDGLCIPNAKFFHHFTIPSGMSITGTCTYNNLWINGFNRDT